MKKAFTILSTVSLTIISSIFSVHASNGDRLQPIYSTDILTYMDGIPIQGYAIDGKTMICVEDLRDYGYTVTYDDSIRTLFVNKTHEPSPDFLPRIERGVVGTVCGYTYETNIKAYVNGTYIETENIGGKLAAVVEDLGQNIYETDLYGVTYSPYYMNYTYDDSTRCLNLSQLPDNELSYEEQIAAVYDHSANFPDDFRNMNRIRLDQLDILTFEKATYGHGYATHLMLFYHNGLYINMSELISQAYRFTRAVDGGSYALLAFNGCLSDDYSTFTFDGEKRGFVSSGPGLHSTQFITSGSYSLDIKSGIVTTISESSEAPDNE